MDGLRTFAALGIVVMHVLSNISVKPNVNVLTGQVIPFFTQFTLMFMSVSAFSMCCGYYERFRNNAITLEDFYTKRYTRILPFFSLLVCLDIALSPSLSSLYEGFADVTLAFGLLPDADIKVIGVGWFLGTIFVFYMLFPFFVFLMANKKRAWMVFVIAICLSWLSTDYFVPRAGKANIIYSSIFFISGGLIYLHREYLVRFVKSCKRLMGVCCIVAFVGYFLLSSVIARYSLGFEVAMLILFSLWMVYAIGGGDCLLQNRFTKYISGISMEVYLSHMVIFRVVERLRLERYISDSDWLYIVVCLLTVGGAIGFSHVVKYVVFPKISDRMKGIRIKIKAQK